MKTTLVIPFRDRGIDPRRAANLKVVLAWWEAHGYSPQVWDDGLSGDDQFNRHRAYNMAVSGNSDTDVFVFTEADMLIDPFQIRLAVRLATRRPGLVVPFTQYRYLSESTTEIMRNVVPHLAGTKDFVSWSPNVFGAPAESTRDNGKSIGAVNVVSRETLDLTGGYTEATSGNWYDDRIIEEGWAFLTGNRTAFSPGPAVHLYHLPGWTGDHLSEEDKRATAENKRILDWMRGKIRTNTPEAVRDLMAYREDN